jgi:hypothetical protein
MMGGAMRWNALLLVPVLAAAAEIGGSSVRTVYILPMSGGLDQYIANQLTREHLLEVIADPTRADAIFTDRLGELLEYKLEKLHPTPKPAVAVETEATTKSEKAEPEKSDSDKAEADKDEADKADSSKNSSEKKDSVAKDKPKAPKTYEDSGPPHTSTFGSGKGTLFLVDAHSRAVLWSIYEKPTVSDPRHLDGTAKHVVNRLKQDLAGK